VPDVTFPLVPRGRIVGLAFGAMRSVRRGTGSDVAGSRAYAPGDDVKAIDWGASARLSSARSRDEFIVRELYAEEAPRVVVVCDRRPEMRLYPPRLPWLRKPAAQRAALELIRASAIDAHGFVGYLDFGDGPGEPFWLPPQSQSLWEYEEREEETSSFDAPRDNLADALEFLLAHPRSVPAGTFVFVLSDFLVSPPVEVWVRALEQRWDVVPVVIQDPVWEQSFPAVERVGLPVASVDGETEEVWLRRREVAARRREHEQRWAALIATFGQLDVEPVVVRSDDPRDILRPFLDWAEMRQAAQGPSW
jgi:uncharacterized protein (DUF58 family)